MPAEQACLFASSSFGYSPGGPYICALVHSICNEKDHRIYTKAKHHANDAYVHARPEASVSVQVFSSFPIYTA
ncbi:MAG: hypothetical protein CSA96_00995 [Bacteroidetes bacterium]|nr:MAG: hypothetical protein CSA96_00995 [Bacteroidota bacterium]